MTGVAMRLPQLSDIGWFHTLGSLPAGAPVASPEAPLVAAIQVSLLGLLIVGVVLQLTVTRARLKRAIYG